MDADGLRLDCRRAAAHARDAVDPHARVATNERKGPPEPLRAPAADFRCCESVDEYVLLGEAHDGSCGHNWETWGNQAFAPRVMGVAAGGPLQEGEPVRSREEHRYVSPEAFHLLEPVLSRPPGT